MIIVQFYEFSPCPLEHETQPTQLACDPNLSHLLLTLFRNLWLLFYIKRFQLLGSRESKSGAERSQLELRTVNKQSGHELAVIRQLNCKSDYYFGGATRR